MSQADRQENGDVSAPSAAVVDLFCGAGGLAHGFFLEGFPIAAGLDLDEGCRFPFEQNNLAPFIKADVGALSADELAAIYPPGSTRVLVGCAPCQPFSTYNQKNEDPNYTLVSKYRDLIISLQPDVVSMENVPRLLEFKGGEIFKDFVAALKREKYHVWHEVVYAPDYGVPQQRKRLVLLASKFGDIKLGAPTHTPDSYLTVEQTIGELEPISAGAISGSDPLHRASGLSALNIRRIKASKPGGTWKDWPIDLRAACHTVESGFGYRSVYGRMSADRPSPTITTQFYGYGNGRFGHPSQDRGLTLREGAMLQSFPQEYEFHPAGERVHFTRLGKLIGNAVPVALSRAIARAVRTHLGEYQKWAAATS